jgi:hypothetical protein
MTQLPPDVDSNGDNATDTDSTDSAQSASPIESNGAGSEQNSENRRNRRKGRRRSKTIPMKRLTREELRYAQEIQEYMATVQRPASRKDCGVGERPCPFVSCKYHLYLDVNPETGSIKLNFPDFEVWELAETCALDVAERGGITLEEVGEILNLTRERIRQVEVRGLDKLREVDEEGDLEGFIRPDIKPRPKPEDSESETESDSES